MARPCPLDRPCLHPAVAHLQEAFGRYRQHLPERQVEEGAARTGCAFAQAPVQRKRIACVRRAETLREVHLVDVAIPDVARHPIEALAIARFGQVGRDAFDAHRALPGQRIADRVLREQRTQPVDRIGAERIRIGDRQHAAPCRVIGKRRPAVDAHRKFGPVPVVLRDRGQALDTARQIVAQVAQRTAGERQIGAGRRGSRAGPGEFPAQQREWISLREVERRCARRVAMAFDLGDAAPCDHRDRRIGDHDIEPRERMRAPGMAVQEHRPGLAGHWRIEIERRGAIGDVELQRQVHRWWHRPPAAAD